MLPEDLIPCECCCKLARLEHGSRATAGDCREWEPGVGMGRSWQRVLSTLRLGLRQRLGILGGQI